MSSLAQDQLLRAAFERGMQMISFSGHNAAMVGSPAGDCDVAVIVVANSQDELGRDAVREIMTLVGAILDQWDKRAKDAAA